jgi:hypothetical protein
MKKAIDFLSNTNCLPHAVSLISLIGLCLSHDIKTTVLFGCVYIGSCFQTRG